MTSGIFAAIALAIAAVSTLAFLSSLYTSAARDIVSVSNGTNAGLIPARIAVRLAPWRKAAYVALAQSESAMGELNESIRDTRYALQLDPADGYLWAYLARLRGTRPATASDLEALYRMAMTRAPNVPPIEWAIAIDGVMRWRLGDEETRALWRESMRFALRRNRRAFLAQVVRLGRDPFWCAANRDALPIGKWCAMAQETRRRCDAPGRSAEVAAWCSAHIPPPRP